jgi:general secretion pathway protein F
VAVFAYRAADQRGQTVDGVMEAPDVRAVVEHLQRDAYFPIKIAVQDQPRRWLGLAWSEMGGRRVAGRDLVSLAHQLATLLEAGLPLDRALAIQAELAPTARLRSIMADVLRTVRGGSSLADALAKHHPRPFSRLYINMVRAGEKGGVLETTLRRLAEFLAESQEFRDALVSALIYPALLIGVGSVAVVFLMTFVIPRFAAIFEDLGATIPWPTLVLLEVSGGLQRYWWVLAGLALALLLATRMILATPRGRLACSCSCRSRVRSSARPRSPASRGSWGPCFEAGSACSRRSPWSRRCWPTRCSRGRSTSSPTACGAAPASPGR